MLSKCDRFGFGYPTLCTIASRCLLEQLRERLEQRVQADAIVDLLHLAGRDRELRPALAVLVVAVGHHGVQPVVAAVKLDDDQDAALRAGRLAGQGIGGPGQEQRDRRAAGQKRGRAQAQAKHLAASRVHGDLL